MTLGFTTTTTYKGKELAEDLESIKEDYKKIIDYHKILCKWHKDAGYRESAELLTKASFDQ